MTNGTYIKKKKTVLSPCYKSDTEYPVIGEIVDKNENRIPRQNMHTECTWDFKLLQLSFLSFVVLCVCGHVHVCNFLYYRYKPGLTSIVFDYLYKLFNFYISFIVCKTSFFFVIYKLCLGR